MGRDRSRPEVLLLSSASDVCLTVQPIRPKSGQSPVGLPVSRVSRRERRVSASQRHWQMCGDRKPFCSPVGRSRAVPGTLLLVFLPVPQIPR